jgi:hypothetical protein
MCSARTKRVGIDVVAAHRMLKNNVPVAEYLLMSDTVYAQCDTALREQLIPIDQQLEGVGSMTGHFIDLESSAREPPPALPDPNLLERA